MICLIIFQKKVIKINKLKIGIDLDDVLNCLVDKWISDYNITYNDNLEKENIKSWDINKYVKPECGDNIYKLLNRPNFFLNLDVKLYAQEVTKWLSEHYDLFIVTAYDYRSCKDKAQWLEKYFPHVPIKNLIFCNHKGLLKLDYIIDDGVHNILDFSKTNSYKRAIIFDAPWNRYLGKKYRRAKDWLDVKDIFKKILEK
jgi:5'-nucleotidase